MRGVHTAVCGRARGRITLHHTLRLGTVGGLDTLVPAYGLLTHRAAVQLGSLALHLAGPRLAAMLALGAVVDSTLVLRALDGALGLLTLGLTSYALQLYMRIQQSPKVRVSDWHDQATRHRPHESLRLGTESCIWADHRWASTALGTAVHRTSICSLGPQRRYTRLQLLHWQH